MKKNDRHLINNSAPLVSIITVCFNSEKYLEQTIQSVVNQTYNNIEYIVIDGGSTDNTLNIIKKYEEHISVWISEPDKNMYDAINKGMALLTGDYWGVLNSDDNYFVDTVETVVNYFRKHPGMNVFTGAEKTIDENDKYLYTRYPPKFNVKSMIRLRTNGIISHSATFLSKEVIRTVGNFNINYSVISDYDYLIRVGLYYPVGHSRKILLNFRQHNNQLTMDSSQMISKEKHRDEIVAMYSKQCDVDFSLVWWDRLRVKLANPLYHGKRLLNKIKESLNL